MNPDTPMAPREETEMRITALLMGELSAEETVALREQMAADPALAKLHDRMRQAMDLLREATAEPGPATATPARLSSERRERLFAHFKGVAPTSAPTVVHIPVPTAKESRRKWAWLMPAAAAAAVICVLASLCFPVSSSMRLSEEGAREIAKTRSDGEKALAWRRREELEEKNTATYEAAKNLAIGQIRETDGAEAASAKKAWDGQSGAITTSGTASFPENQAYKTYSSNGGYGWESGANTETPYDPLKPQVNAQSNLTFGGTIIPATRLPDATPASASAKAASKKTSVQTPNYPLFFGGGTSDAPSKPGASALYLPPTTDAASNGDATPQLQSSTLAITKSGAGAIAVGGSGTLTLNSNNPATELPKLASTEATSHGLNGEPAPQSQLSASKFAAFEAADIRRERETGNNLNEQMVPTHREGIQKVKSLFVAADNAKQLGRNELSLQKYEEILNIDPNNAVALKNREEIYALKANPAIDAYNATRSQAMNEVSKQWDRPYRRLDEKNAVGKGAGGAAGTSAGAIPELGKIPLMGKLSDDATAYTGTTAISGGTLSLGDSKTDKRSKGTSAVIAGAIASLPETPRIRAAAGIELPQADLAAGTDFTSSYILRPRLVGGYGTSIPENAAPDTESNPIATYGGVISNTAPKSGPNPTEPGTAGSNDKLAAKNKFAEIRQNNLEELSFDWLLKPGSDGERDVKWSGQIKTSKETAVESSKANVNTASEGTYWDEPLAKNPSTDKSGLEKANLPKAPIAPAAAEAGGARRDLLAKNDGDTFESDERRELKKALDSEPLPKVAATSPVPRQASPEAKPAPASTPKPVVKAPGAVVMNEETAFELRKAEKGFGKFEPINEYWGGLDEKETRAGQREETPEKAAPELAVAAKDTAKEKQSADFKISLGRKQVVQSAPEQAKRITTNSALEKVALPVKPQLPGTMNGRQRESSIHPPKAEVVEDASSVVEGLALERQSELKFNSAIESDQKLSSVIPKGEVENNEEAAEKQADKFKVRAQYGTKREQLKTDTQPAARKRSEENLSKAAAEKTKENLRDEESAAPKPVEPAAIPQPEVATSANAFSTFSLNVSDVSFKLAGASLEKGRMPELATVRSEEFINAFDYHDPEPAAGAPLAFATERARYPFAQNRDLVRFSVKTAAAGRQPGRPLNIVLLLDNSGSMERADRVRILREALRVLAAQLQPQDKLSVITFARTPRLWADGVAGDKAGEAVGRVAEITPQGGTNLDAALDLGYKTALKHFQPGGISRVVMLTDGAANLGDVNPDALKQKVEANRRQGVALDCFGIGWEGYDDTLLETLARNGDGRYGFINTPEEAASGFAAQLAGALRVAASDVKVQVEWNPRRVTAYRQIGYAKHQLKKEQFRDNTVDAAEIGAAESGNALYVVEVNPRGTGDIATVRVRFKVPGTSDYKEHEWAVPFTPNTPSLEQASPALRLAGTASAFSEWLVASPFAAEVTPDRLLGLLNGVPATYAADPRPKKLEWMIRTAKSVSGR